MKSDKNDMMKTTSRVSAIFSIMSEDMDLKKQNDQRARFYLAGSQGNIKLPDDWDSLSDEVKKQRLDQMDSIGLNQE